jgi:hypothetical protein
MDQDLAMVRRPEVFRLGSRGSAQVSVSRRISVRQPLAGVWHFIKPLLK